MTMTRGWHIWLVVLGAALLGGCGKTVELSFLNLTSDSINVYVTTPQQGRQFVGIVAPMGRLSHTIMVPEDKLPANCVWQTGSVSQSFTVTRETGDQEVKILPGGAPQMRDRDSSLKEMLEPDINPRPAGPPSPPATETPKGELAPPGGGF
jgi:hypothetical protein